MESRRSLRPSEPSGELTRDEPYVPDMGSDEDNDAVLRSVRSLHIGASPLKETIEEGAPWQQKGNRDGRSLVPIDEVFKQKLRDLEEKLDRGEPLTDEDAEYVNNRTLLGILRVNRRPALRLKATQLLQQARLKNLVQKSIETKGETTDHGLALPE